MTDTLIDGVGMTRFESESTRSVVGLAALAAERAIDDSPHGWADVTSLHVGNALAEALGTRAGTANALAAALGLEGVATDRVENTSATGASACHRGVDAVERGGGVALVVGVEKMSVAETSAVTGAIGRLVHDREYEQGLTLPAFAGLAAGTYLDRHDAPREALAAVARKNHRNAVDNEFAQFRRPVTIDEALESPVVADPLRLYDCCPMTDGAAALVLSHEDAAAADDADTSADDTSASAREGDRAPAGAVRVASATSATGSHAIADRADPLELASVRTAGERAFDAAGLGPADVDVACIHDAFTVLELLELEELGFYAPGTAWRATLDGETAVDGALPVNPGGGLKARGHPLGATGISQIVELVWQLRGDLPRGRGVPDADTGLAVNVAGFGNNSVCMVLTA